MAESITLATPEVVSRTTTDYRIGRMTFDPDAQLILILFRGTNGEQREWRVEGATAMTRMRALMKADLSTKSLPRRIMEAAIADGVFAGTISGAPD